MTQQVETPLESQPQKKRFNPCTGKGTQKTFSYDEVFEALRACKGKVAKTAHMLQCSTKTVYNYISVHYPELKLYRGDIDEAKFDMAEEVLEENAFRKKNVRAAEIILKRSNRGYSDKTELVLNKPIEFILTKDNAAVL